MLGPLLTISCLILLISAKEGLYGKLDGNIYVGGLFPTHGRGENRQCNLTHIQRDGIYSLEAFYFSLDQLNAQVLGPCCGITLGAVTMDTCMSERQGLHKALKFVVKHMVTGDKKPEGDFYDVIGVVGPMHSAVAEQVANLLSMFGIPMISYMGTSPSLNKYPYFLRTVPSDQNQAGMLVQILLQWGWTYIHGIWEDSVYGSRGFQAFESMAVRNGICFADRLKIDIDRIDKNQMDYFRVKLRKMAEKNRARVVILYATEKFAGLIFQIAMEENLDDRFIWIGTDGWGSRYLNPDVCSVIEGAITSIPVFQHLPGFEEYFYKLRPSTNTRNPWFKSFWEFILNCRFKPTNGFSICNEKEQTLKETIKSWEFGYMHFVRDAVMAYGYALKQMHSSLCGKGYKGLCESLFKELDTPDSKMLLANLKDVYFPGVHGHNVSFFMKQDGMPIYSIMNYQRLHDGTCNWVQINRFGADITNQRPGNESMGMVRFRKNIIPKSVCGTPCQSGYYRKYLRDKCCWRCEPCQFPTYQYNETNCVICPLEPPNFTIPNMYRNGCNPLKPTVVGFQDPSVIAVTSFAGLGIVLTIATLIVFTIYSGTPIIKAAGRELSIVLLIGILLCYITVFVVGLEPSPYTCACVRFLYSISYSVCYASIFVKTNRIVRIFQHSDGGYKPKRTKYINPISQIVAVGLIIGFQCILNAVWLLLRPPFADFKVDRDSIQETIQVYYFCEAFEDEDMVVALVLPFVLLLLTALYAFKARKCPGKFNETKYIIITTYTTCIVWIAFIPVFFATERIPVRLFALCATLSLNATVTLICLFVPKLYVALFRPHKNTKDVVMGRKSTNSLFSKNNSSSGNNMMVVNGEQEPLAKNSVCFSLSSSTNSSRNENSLRIRRSRRDNTICENGEFTRNQAVQTDSPYRSPSSLSYEEGMC